VNLIAFDVIDFRKEQSMKKTWKIALSSLFLAIGALGAGVAGGKALAAEPQMAEADTTFIPNGSVNGGAKITFTATTASSTSTLRFTPSVQDFSGDGVYLRMRNYSATETPIDFFLLCTNNHAVAATAGAAFSTYDAEGANVTARTFRSFGSYLMLPSSFDGFVYIPYTSLSDKSGWSGNTGTTVTYNSVFSLYFTIDTYYDSYASFALGDVFTETTSIVKAADLTTTTFGTTYNADGTTANIHIARLPLTDVDIAAHDFKGGAAITMNYNATDLGCYWLCVPATRNFTGTGLYMRMRNRTAADLWFQFYLLFSNNHREAMNQNAEVDYYDAAGTTKTVTNSRSFLSYLFLPASFNGTIYVPYASMVSDPNWSPNTTATTKDYTATYACIFGLSAYYDAAANFVIGDIYTNVFDLYDGTASTKAGFASVFFSDPNGNGSYVNVKHYPGYSDDAATTFAEAFLTATANCTTAAAGVWDDQAAAFALLETDFQTVLKETDLCAMPMTIATRWSSACGATT
jgi:hypothetical protein